MSKPWVFTPSDKPPVLVYGAFVKSVVVLILMKIVTLVSTFISTFIDRNSVRLGRIYVCLGHPPSRAGNLHIFSPSSKEGAQEQQAGEWFWFRALLSTPVRSHVSDRIPPAAGGRRPAANSAAAVADSQSPRLTPLTSLELCLTPDQGRPHLWIPDLRDVADDDAMASRIRSI